MTFVYWKFVFNSLDRNFCFIEYNLGEKKVFYKWRSMVKQLVYTCTWAFFFLGYTVWVWKFQEKGWLFQGLYHVEHSVLKECLRLAFSLQGLFSTGYILPTFYLGLFPQVLPSRDLPHLELTFFYQDFSPSFFTQSSHFAHRSFFLFLHPRLFHHGFLPRNTM